MIRNFFAAIKRVGLVVFSVLLTLLIIGVPGRAVALTSADIQSIIGHTPYYDPNAENECSATATQATTSTSGPVSIIGDSITQRAQDAYTAAFQAKGLSVSIDASVSRSLTNGGTTGNKLSGLDAIDKGSANIQSASVVVVALGTNGGTSAATIDKAIAAIRAKNSSATIYWVDTISVNGRVNYNQDVIKPVNTAIYGESASQNYKVISWFKAVDSGGNPLAPNGAEVDPNKYIDNKDGLGVHPTSAGVSALTNLVVSTVAVANTGTGGSCSCSLANSGVTAQLAGSDNQQKAFNYFKDAEGLNDTQAAAIVGNLMQESGVNPSSKQGGGPGTGIAQWSNPGRWNNLTKFASQNSLEPNDLSTQLQFMSAELHSKSPAGDYTKTLANLKAQTTIEDATGYFMGTASARKLDSATQAFIAAHGKVSGYENPGTPALNNRIADAKSVLQKYGNGVATGVDASCVTPGSINCNNASNAQPAASQLRQSVVCGAENELALWKSGQLKPGKDFYKYSGGRNENWCADFVSWIYTQAGKPVKQPSSQAWKTIKGFTFHNDGSYVPQPGDVVVYTDKSSPSTGHVNIVISVSGKTMNVIGGNQGAKGGGVSASKVTEGDNINTALGTSYGGPIITGYVSPNE